tara:strand:- start:2467 stop:2772 length:306 start_codon:yes stop_codon:yes gene_type:complete
MNTEDILKEYNTVKPRNKPVKFRDGRLSIQASSFHYCHPKHDHGPYTCVEVAYLVDNTFGKVPELGDTSDDVYGYTDIKLVMSLLMDEGYTSTEILKIMPR